MNPKLLLLLLSTLCTVNLNNATTVPNNKANFDTLKMWTVVGDWQAIGLSNANNIKAAITLIRVLSKAIPYAGPLAILVSEMLGMGTKHELSQVMDKLKEMNAKLDKLDSRFSEVLNKIESVQIIAGYKSKIEQVINLKHAYVRFAANPTNKTRDDFKAECGAHKMMMFARWIESEVNADALLPLRKVMLEYYDMTNFNYWSNQIAALLSNAMFLHSTCLGVSGYNQTTILHTLTGQNGNRGDIAIFNQILKNVMRGFNQGVKFIKRSFFSHAVVEVETFMETHQDGWNHQDFAYKLHQMLSEKYFWRLWGVVSWSDEADTASIDEYYHHLDVDPNAWYWENEFGRNLIVGLVLPDRSNKIYKQLKDEIERCRKATAFRSVYFDKSRLLNVRSILNFCHELYHHDTNSTLALRAVILGHIYEGATWTFPGFYQRGTYNPRKFHRDKFFCFLDDVSRTDALVIAIPYDSSATITEGEVCTATGFWCSRDEHCCAKHEEMNEYFCCPDTTSCAENGCE